MAYGKVRVDQVQSSTRTVDVDNITLTDDARLSNSREWTADTISQAEAEAGTATTRRAFTAQRTFQAIAAWWAASAFKTKLDGIETGAEVNINADWNASSGDAQILNKPTLGTAAATAATDYATAAQGVTNGNSHDHNGGDGAQIAYSSLSGTPTIGTAAGNLVQLDGSARLPAVDGSQLTGINAATDLTYTAATRVLASSTGTDATLTLVTSTDAGLAPASGGGTTNFLRADGTWAAAGSPPAGTDTQIQFNDSSAFGGDADLTWNKTTNVMTVTGDVNLSDGGTYTTTLQTITPTAARTISFPNATGTVGLVGGSSGNLVVNQSGAYAGVANSSVDNATGNITLGSRFISSLNGAASAPPGAFTGTWFSGGTATTTKPQVVIEPTGTTSTAWSTAGTGFGVNAASGFAGNLLDLQVNGTSHFRFSTTGLINATGLASIQIGNGAGSSNHVILNGAGSRSLECFSNTSVNIAHTLPFGWSTATNTAPDAAWNRDAADTIAQRRGTNAQTFRVYGTYTDASNYVRASLSSSSTAVTLAAQTAGTGADDIPLNLTAAGTGTIKVNSVAEVVVSSTVAGLPAAPVVGMLTRVTDATAPAVGVTVVGGGAAAALVWYNGAAWSVIGV